MNKLGTKFASGRILIGLMLALAVLLAPSSARAKNPPISAVALAQKIKARIQPELPSHLMVAEVSLPSALTPFADYQLAVTPPRVSQEGQVSVLVTLRGADGSEARAWVRVIIESRLGAHR